MKVLVVSLLRLGDIFQQVPLLKALRHSSEGLEIHLLINEQFKSAVPILDGLVDQIHFFDRDKFMQSGIAELVSRNLLLDELLADVCEIEFDKIYNFTHTRLSIEVISRLKAQSTVGLHLDPVGKVSGLRGNIWLEYYNEYFSGNRKSFFNTVEVLARAFGLSYETSPVEFRESQLILFQCLTSDEKKNWSLPKFKELMHLIKAHDSDLDIKVLAAPGETEVLGSYFEKDEILVCNIQEAQDLLKTARMLVTLDTSIKHLGVLSHTPIVEIALGSSDLNKTGAFASETWRVKSSVHCAPCVHSEKCHQNSQICGEEISVQQVFSKVLRCLNRVPDIEEVSTHRRVWEAYLNGEDLDGFSGAFYYSEIERQSQLRQRLSKMQSSFEILSSQESLTIQTEIFLPMLTELKQALLIDEGAYFQSLKDSFMDRFSDADALMNKISEALDKTKKLMDLHSAAFGMTNANYEQEAQGCTS